MAEPTAEDYAAVFAEAAKHGPEAVRETKRLVDSIMEIHREREELRQENDRLRGQVKVREQAYLEADARSEIHRGEEYAIEQLLVALQARNDRLAEALRLLVKSIEKWEKDVEKVIGRVPRHYIELDQARDVLKENQP